MSFVLFFVLFPTIYLLLQLIMYYSFEILSFPFLLYFSKKTFYRKKAFTLNATMFMLFCYFSVN